MASETFKLRKTSDTEFLSYLNQFLQSEGGEAFSKVVFTFRFDADLQYIDAPKLREPFENELLKSCNGASALIQEAKLSDSRANVEFNRRNDQFDQVTVATIGNGTDAQKANIPHAMAATVGIQDAFRTVFLSSYASFFDVESQEILKAKKEVLADLIQTVREATKGVTDRSIELDRNHQTKRESLQHEFDELKSKQEAEYERRKTGLAEAEAELQARITEQNTKAPIAERRRVFNTLLEELKDLDVANRFNSESKSMFLSTAVILSLAVIITGLGAFFTTYLLSSSIEKSGTSLTSVDIYMMVKNAVSAIAFVTFVVWLIRYLKSWSDRLASEQFRTKRLKLDMNRAHWFTELCFQWKSEFDQEIPDNIVRHLAAGMFEDSNFHHESANFESLLTLMTGASTKLKIGKEGMELETTPDRKPSA